MRLNFLAQFPEDSIRKIALGQFILPGLYCYRVEEGRTACDFDQRAVRLLEVFNSLIWLFNIATVF